MIRIIAGSLRGRSIRVAPNPALRPTGNKVREAVFNILAARIEIEGLRFLDAYAGSGAVGIEALSRGAAFAEFLEADRKTARVLSDALSELGLAGRSRVTSSLRPVELDFDILFADPPYAVTAPALDASVLALRDGGRAIIETSSFEPPAITGMRIERSYRYGKAHLHLFIKEAP